ncbi:MAG: MBL fold metallo-hydrolase [Propionibacteriaceae bacterium]|jgi:glyoxylase-like metal-dependent hydrolase (beta-lactamase superfamily II)|nr:MBL fold metallo-hydrolase [Propionibacteriaceae bacterium]
MGPILPDKLAIVFLVSIETALWGENCWVLAREESGPALVIDPGLGAADAVGQLCADQDLTVTAVLASHGHLDHVADAAQLADRWDAPLYIHPFDRELLADPAAGLDPAMRSVAAQLAGPEGWHEPKTVRDLTDRVTFAAAGFDVTVLWAPGHRPGCVIFRVPAEDRLLAFTGDVLFAGSIGRTDLPGGSMPQMAASLRDVVLGAGPDGQLHLPDDAIVLPGHGPHSTMAAERASNPYLQPNFLENYA